LRGFIYSVCEVIASGRIGLRSLIENSKFIYCPPSKTALKAGDGFTCTEIFLAPPLLAHNQLANASILQAVNWIIIVGTGRNHRARCVVRKDQRNTRTISSEQQKYSVWASAISDR